MLNTKKNKKIRRNRIIYLIQENFLVSVIIAVAIIAMVISGIVATVNSRERNKDSDTKTTLVKADTINLAMFEPRNFNVYESNDEDIFYINQLVYSSLFKLDKNLNITPDVVSKYSVDTSNGEVNISLKDNVKFSDGSDLESSDVKASVDRIIAAESRSPYFVYASKINHIQINDSKNFTVVFKSASDAALDNLIFPITSAGEYKKGESFAIGSGPYAYSGHESGKTLKLAVNKYYYDGIAKLPIVFNIVKDRSVIPGLMTMDVVTAYLNKTQDADSIAQDKKLKYKKLASGELEYLGFNHENKYCSNSKFRIAISKAIDSSKIIKYNYAGAAVTSDSIYYPNFLGAKKDDTFNFEPKKATKLLKELKLKDRDEDGIIEDESGNPVTLRILVQNTNKQRLEAAETIIENLKQIGINAELVSVDADSYKDKLESKQYDIYFGGIKIDKQFNLTDLYTTYNKIGFSDSKLLTQISRLEQSLSSEEQLKQFTAIKKSINQDASYVPVCYKAYWFLSVDTLKNADDVSFYSPYDGAVKWQWSKRKTK